MTCYPYGRDRNLPVIVWIRGTKVNSYYTYYTASIWFTVFAMVIMLVAVGINPAMDESHRRVTRLLFVTIILSSLCEWTGNMLDNAPVQLIWLHRLVKLVELSVAPYIGLICGRSLNVRGGKWEKIIGTVLSLHVVVESLSSLMGWVWYVDAENVYHHGSFYGVYIICYTIGIIYYLVQGLRAARRYQQSGGVVLLLVTAFLFGGIALSQIRDDVEITWMTVGMSSMMLYKFYSDILQQVDGLTELGNRWGYEDRLQRTHGRGAILYFDVDCFKQINDTHGHKAGDQCLCMVAQCLRDVYGMSGRIYRLGGDEFCVILTRNVDRIDQLNAAFACRLQNNRAQLPWLPDVSTGYAVFDTSEEELGSAVERADAAMYRVKNEKKAAARS